MSTKQDAPALWTIQEAAKALAISQRKLWGLTNDKAIPCVRIGRSVRYDPADIRAYIGAQKSCDRAAQNEPELT
jgi:excisionase family DNA binding protein